MKRVFLVFGAVVWGGLLLNVSLLQAESTLVSSGAGLKQELKSNRQQIKEALVERKDNSQEAKSEEQKLKEHIKAALDSGDYKTARQLKEQWVAVHQKNLQEKSQDIKDIQGSKQEFKNDIQEARQKNYLPPELDKNNNPPGPLGGAGTNWENPPGPKGGPGASPERRGNQ